jgi:hypothetical protein
VAGEAPVLDRVAQPLADQPVVVERRAGDVPQVVLEQVVPA